MAFCRLTREARALVAAIVVEKARVEEYFGPGWRCARCLRTCNGAQVGPQIAFVVVHPWSRNVWPWTTFRKRAANALLLYVPHRLVAEV